MEKGDIVKYLATSTVGKVEDVAVRDGTVWVKLDKTGLYYREDSLVTASAAEYKPVSVKDESPKRKKITKQAVVDLNQMENDVDISEIDANGGG